MERKKEEFKKAQLNYFDLSLDFLGLFGFIPLWCFLQVVLYIGRSLCLSHQKGMQQS